MIEHGDTKRRKAKRLYPALRERVYAAGYNLMQIGELCGLSKSSTTLRFCGKVEWTQEDIEIIANEIGLNYEEIGRLFFYTRGQDQYEKGNR